MNKSAIEPDILYTYITLDKSYRVCTWERFNIFRVNIEEIGD